MSYFMLDPFSVGWQTSKVMSLLPQEMLLPADSSYLGYSSSKSIGNVRKAVGTLIDNKYVSDEKKKQSPYWGKRKRVEEYYKKLGGIGSADVVIVTTDDTMASKPPHTLRKLSPDHPANKSTRMYSGLLGQLKAQTGITGYLAFIDPPYLPAVVVDGAIHPDLRGSYFPHNFTHWADLEKQEKRMKREVHRKEMYEQAYKELYPEWEKEFYVREFSPEWEGLLQTSLAGVAAERMVDFLSAKCGKDVFMIVPNYGIMKGIKSMVIEGIKERKPSILRKGGEFVDVVKEFTNNRTYEKDMTCSASVFNRMVAYFENIYGLEYQKTVDARFINPRVNIDKFAGKCPFGYIYSEWAPSRGTHCIYREDEKKCMLHAFEDVLSEYDAGTQERVRKFMIERDLHIPSVETVIKEIEFNLDGRLEPVRLPDNDVDRNDAETSCSEVSGARNTVEFFLKKQGLLEVPPEVRFLGTVGTICHDTMYRGAPERWQKGMEKPGIIRLSMLYKEQPTTIHMKPDIASFQADNLLITLDTKSGPVFYEKWLPRKSHARQVAGYSWYIEDCFEGGFDGEYGVIIHLQDFQTGRPTLVPFRTGQESRARRQFFSRARNLVLHKRRWERNPELFMNDFFGDHTYSFENTKDDRRIQHAWPSVAAFAEKNGLDVKYKSQLDELRRAYRNVYGVDMPNDR